MVSDAVKAALTFAVPAAVVGVKVTVQDDDAPEPDNMHVDVRKLPVTPVSATGTGGNM